MCTVVVSIAASVDWPLLLAANRDEKLDRKSLPPGFHWPDYPETIAGRDILAGGTWLGVSKAGMVAAVLNRLGSLGPAPGKRSRGDLPLLALAHPTVADASHALTQLDAGHWRSFNLILADRQGAMFLRGTGQGRISAQALSPGIHMITARDPNDMSSPRVARNLPRFRRAAVPAPPEWSTWPALLADATPPAEAALNITPFSGFGTVSSTLIALGRETMFLTADGAPGSTPYHAVDLPASWGGTPL